MPVAAFNPFTGVLGGDSARPSIYDVQRRQKLGERLAGTQYIQDSGPLGALAQALGGSLGAYENSIASNEAQTGQDAARQALAKALTGGTTDPAELLNAGGDPFLPESEAGLVGDMLKKRLGLGTVYGNSMPYLGADKKLHFAAQDSYGNTLDLPAPGGGQWLAPVTQNNLGTSITPTSKFGGDIGLPEQATAPLTINNAQKSFDEQWGAALGKDWAAAPEQLQKEGNLVQQQTASHEMVSNKIDQAISAIDANPGMMAGFVGDILAAPKGTPQYDLAQQLETIKANIGFDQLQNMKDNSATGSSGLGQISNMEEQLLQAINGSLQQGQSAGQLKANLLDIKQRIAQIIEQKKQAVLQDIQRYKSGPQLAPTLGSGTTTNLPANALPDVGGSPGMPKAGDVLDGYRFKGGDPADSSNWEKV